VADLDELDALHAAATAGEWVVRSYQEPSGEFNPAPSWEVYDEDNLVLTAALHNAWPTVSARLRAAEAEVERLRGALLEAASEMDSECDGWGADARAALGEP
jgi:hypothetical protein